MTAHLLITWLNLYFEPTLEIWCSRKKNTIFKILLPIDNVPGHPRAVLVMYNKINVVFLPVNTASIL